MQRDIPVEDVIQILDHIDPAQLSYDEWIAAVGAALRAGVPESDIERWSAQDPRFSHDDISRRAAGLKSGGTATVGTLAYLAKEHSNGWTAPSSAQTRRRSPSPRQRVPRKTPWQDLPEPEIVPDAGQDRTQTQQMADYLRELFRPEEYINIVFAHDDKEKPAPVGKGAILTCEDCCSMIERKGADVAEDVRNRFAAEKGRYHSAAGAWVRINPTVEEPRGAKQKDGTYSGKGVADTDITAFRYALVECDDIPQDSQIDAYRRLRLPVVALVDSAGKSIHAVCRVDAPDSETYRKRVQQLHDYCTRHGLKIDAANKNPARLTRLPGIKRGDRLQELLGFRQSDIWSWEQFESEVLNADFDLDPDVELTPADVFTDSDSDVWPQIDPLREDVHAADPFPVELLPEEIGDMVQAVATQLQVPEGMPAAFALGVLAAAVGAGYDVELNSDWIEPLNLWTVVSADSSDRKTQVKKQMCRPLLDIERELREQAQIDIQEDKFKFDRIENRLKILKAKDAKQGLSPEEEQKYRELSIAAANHVPLKEPRLIIDDCTPESLVEVLRDNRGCAAMISDEPGIFGKVKTKPDKESGIEIYLQLFSGADIRQNRIGRGEITVESPRMSCMVCSQPEVLRGVMQDRELHGRGFFARWLYADMTRLSKVGYREIDPPEISPDVREKYHQMISDLYEQPPEHGEPRRTIKLSTEAREVFRRYQEINEHGLRPGGFLYRAKEWGGKLNGQTLRIAGLLHAASIGPGFVDAPISGQTMMTAQLIAAWFCGQALPLFEAAGGESAEAYLLSFLWRYGEPITFKLLQDKTRYKKRKELKQEVLSALYELQQRGYVKLIRRKTKGRPTDEIVLNPAVFSQP